MILHDFDYFRPATIAQALSLLEANPDSCCLLGGGTDLIVRLKQGRLTPKIVIDLKELNLSGLSFASNDVCKIGALTTLRDIEISPEIASNYPALHEAVTHMASKQIRSRATIGGNLCNAAPSADTAPPLLVYEASLVAESPSADKVNQNKKTKPVSIRRNISIRQFFNGPGLNSLNQNEILTEVLLPLLPARTGSTYLKLRRTEKDIAIVGVAALITLDSQGTHCIDAKIALGAVASTPVRASAAEELLRGRPLTDEILNMAAKAALLDAKPIDDFRASARYRRDMIKELTLRALRTATSRAESSNKGGEDKMLHTINVEVNGEKYVLEVTSKETLLKMLRQRLNLTGTKEGCGTGDCGACTVIMNGRPVNSCLVLACETDGSKITTIEGLVKNGRLHPLQESFINEGSVQCGFCSPGMIMSAKALLDEHPDPTEDEILTAIAGNLCRCTGYLKIIKAVKTAARKMEEA
ncbi:FAD binding domain-containing protein [Pelotomaculum propionicicum]|uniref:Nicotinate dehydrogenase small FeS subunit n=1 Tax=Pelotomaculum propionicicum TaxID=258475 RepID=A0A4Y7RIZ3_9FIRM|nr:Nicotinate dehydrogenase small FeS subunit [Pelotomaculum propionicicum]